MVDRIIWGSEAMGGIEAKDMPIEWDHSLANDAQETEVLAEKKRNHRQRYRAARREEYLLKRRGITFRWILE